jgi:glycerate 2-kinase
MEPRLRNAGTLISHGNVRGRTAMVEILEAGLQAADPYRNTRTLVRLEDGRIRVGGAGFAPVGDPQAEEEFVARLADIDRIFVFGAGKGVQRSAKALEDVLGDALTGGHVIDKSGHPVICEKIGVTLGGHPVPDEHCVEGSEAILRMCSHLTENDLVFVLAGNGISSLLTFPVPEVSLEEVRETTRLLQIELGLPTPEVNAVRNHLDRMKSGRITRLMQPATTIHVLLVDPGVYRDLMLRNFWLHTLPDCTTFAEALDVLNGHDALDKVPASVRRFLQRADPHAETVKAAEFERFAPWRIFGVTPSQSPTGVFPTAMKKAEELGFRPLFLAENVWFVEAAQAGAMAGCIARQVESGGQPAEPPVVLFSGGEMVVSVGNEPGTGGRNQEYAVSASLRISGSENIVIGSVDTDGTDGPGHQGEGELDMPHCLAGGIVDGYTLAEAEVAGIDMVSELRRHNTSPTLWKLGCGVHAAPGVSAQDLTVIMVLDRGGETQSPTTMGTVGKSAARP